MKGFTLIELLIAMVIFSIISMATLSSVNHMMRAREQQLVHHEANQSLDEAYAHIFQDMMWFVGGVSSTPDDLKFSRTQTTQSNSLAVVHYRLIEGKLFRAVNEQAVILLKEAQDFRLSWLLNNHQWVGVFDQANITEAPLLFRVQFKTPHLGEVTWVFATPAAQ